MALTRAISRVITRAAPSFMKSGAARATKAIGSCECPSNSPSSSTSTLHVDGHSAILFVLAFLFGGFGGQFWDSRNYLVAKIERIKDRAFFGGVLLTVEFDL